MKDDFLQPLVAAPDRAEERGHADGSTAPLPPRRCPACDLELLNCELKDMKCLNCLSTFDLDTAERGKPSLVLSSDSAKLLNWVAGEPLWPVPSGGGNLNIKESQDSGNKDNSTQES